MTRLSVRSSVWVLSGVAVSATLLGCAGPMSSGNVDYRSTQAPQRPLDIPPQLTPLPRNDRYVVPERPSALAAQPQSTAVAANTVAVRGPNARIERAGTQRWLATDVSPEQAFAVVREFLPTLGLKIEREDAQLGILETEWAENRAKLPQDIIRRTLGRVLDGLYSTGEQDKYRVRIERTAADTAEVYISHRGMIEVYTNSAQERTRWQPRPTDTAMEAELLQRLLVRLAQPQAPRSVVEATAKPAEVPDTAPVARVVRAQNETQVQVSESFDRAWRRVGLALDRGGFTVEDRDRAAGFYYVRYLDPEYEAREREKQGMFSKWFGREYKVEAQQFRVRVQADGETSRVSVLDRDGKPDASDTAAKIIKQLVEQMR